MCISPCAAKERSNSSTSSMGSKKKRVPPAAPASRSAEAASKNSHLKANAPDAATQEKLPPIMSIDTAAAYYFLLRRDAARLEWRLGGALWIHQAVGLVIVNILMYDLEVHTHELVLVAWSAVWLGRGFVTERLVKAITRVDMHTRIMVCRVVALIIFVGAALALHYSVWKRIPRLACAYLTAISVADVLSISYVGENASHSYATLGDVLEMIFIIVVFSTQYNERTWLVYDRVAIAFVIATLVIHCYVIHGVKHAVLVLPWTDKLVEERGQHRRLEAVAAIGAAVDAAMNDWASTPSSQKKIQDDHEAPSAASETSFARLMTLSGSVEAVTLWLVVQTATVAVQLFATAFVLHSWELCSILMCTSVHLLIEVLLLHVSLTRTYPLQRFIDKTNDRSTPASAS